MKVTATALLALFGSAAALQPARPATALKSTAVETEAPVAAAPAVAEAPKEEVAQLEAAFAATENKDRIQPGRYDEGCQSIALPWLKRPTNLDGTHAGDFGFDPLGLSETYDLYTMQEAELRHGRLAMLAVVGWPMSELIAPDWMLRANGCAPSVLNGFNPVSFLATMGFLGAAGFFEYKTSLRRVNDTPMGKQHSEDMADIWKYGVAGDYNFDPAGLYSSIGDDAMARKGLREVEVSHGRSAMLGITSFAGWEFLTGHAVTESFGMFFHPNLLLPALAASYAFATSIYELEESDQYIRLQVSSEGNARLENLKLSTKQLTEFAESKTPSAEETMDAFEKAKTLAKTIKDKYDSLNEDYTKSVMKNIE